MICVRELMFVPYFNVIRVIGCLLVLIFPHFNLLLAQCVSLCVILTRVVCSISEYSLVRFNSNLVLLLY